MINACITLSTNPLRLILTRRGGTKHIAIYYMVKFGRMVESHSTSLNVTGLCNRWW